MHLRKIFLLLLLPGKIFAQNPPDVLADQIQPTIFALTRVMMHDVVNPPAACRYYAYCTLGAYEIVAANSGGLIPINKTVKTFPLMKPQPVKNYKLAALYCILESGRLMLPSGYLLEEDEKTFVEQQKKNGIPEDDLNQAIAAAKEMTTAIIAWSKTDDYNKLSARLRYKPIKGDAYWYPTPPAYMEAVEPNWRTVRPMVIDSCGQFKPVPPVVFSKDSNSAFYKLAKEVYTVSLHAPKEQLEIAGFWDCNPFAIATSGHMAIGFKKISPGGHWMNIGGIACKKAHLGFAQSLCVQTMLALSMMDAFISCWDEKYRSNRVRPETFINKNINLKWQPLLQTPPFPEYTSGHSVVSTTAAEVLSYFLGDKFDYTDDSEILFEIQPRRFGSFRQAAEEASISRLYGGIHFRDAIVNGQKEGRDIGKFVVAKMKMAGIKSFHK